MLDHSVRTKVSLPHLRGMKSWESAQSDDTARPERGIVEEEDATTSNGEDDRAVQRPTNGGRSTPSPETLLSLEKQARVRTEFQAADVYCRTELFDYLAGDIRLAFPDDHPIGSYSVLLSEDPRFSIWETLPPVPSEPTSGQPNIYTRKRMHSSPSMYNAHVHSPPVQLHPPSRRLVGATLERWIHQLTITFDREAIYAFLLTYRVVCSPLDLARLLIARFEWAITPDGHRGIREVEELKSMARARTFHVWKFWLMYFFEVDWLGNVELRALMADWVNDMRKREELDKVPTAMVCLLFLCLSFFFCG